MHVKIYYKNLRLETRRKGELHWQQGARCVAGASILVSTHRGTPTHGSPPAAMCALTCCVCCACSSFCPLLAKYSRRALARMASQVGFKRCCSVLPAALHFVLQFCNIRRICWGSLLVACGTFATMFCSCSSVRVSMGPSKCRSFQGIQASARVPKGGPSFDSWICCRAPSRFDIVPSVRCCSSCDKQSPSNTDQPDMDTLLLSTCSYCCRPVLPHAEVGATVHGDMTLRINYRLTIAEVRRAGHVCGEFQAVWG